VPIGNLLAAAVLAVMSAVQNEHDFLAWGWRVPFLLSGVLIAIGWWVRTTVEESPEFLAARAAAKAEQVRVPVMEAIRKRPGGLAIGAGLRIGENTTYYLITAFSIVYLTEHVHKGRGIALTALLLAAGAEALTMPLFAMLSDGIGRRPVYALAAGGMALWAFAFFRMLDGGSPTLIVVALVGGLILHGAMYGTQASFMVELFPTRYRYSGVSLAAQATSVVAGSLAPLVAVALLQHANSATPIAIYMAATAAVSVVAALAARETKGLTYAEIDARAG